MKITLYLFDLSKIVKTIYQKEKIKRKSYDYIISKKK